MAPPAYPRRPPFFAHRFTRLLTKACVANELGTDAVLLLIAIAHQEDAKKYSGAVSWWNGQLMPLIGCRSESTFKRIRARCVESGWLHYDAGSKTRSASYWVNIPRTHTHWNDAPTDENATEYAADSGSKMTGNVTRKGADSSPPVTGNPAGIRTECGPESGRNPDGIRPPSIPDPDPKESDASHLSGSAPPPAPPGPPPGEPVPEAKKPRKEPSGAHHESIRRFCDAWAVKYGERYPFAGGKDATAVAWMLDQCGGDVAKLAGVFARFLADTSEYHAAGDRHTLARLRQFFPRWFVAAPLPSTRSPPGGRTKGEAQEEYIRRQLAGLED